MSAGLKESTSTSTRASGNRKRGTASTRRVAAEGTKKCSDCGEIKQKSEFYFKKARADGLSSQCKTCDGERRRIHRLKGYGLLPSDYDRILAEQGNVCAICQKPEVGKNRRQRHGDAQRLAVDHDHDTGKVRGLLCHMCNRRIGLLGDNIESFERILKYLKGELYG